MMDRVTRLLAIATIVVVAAGCKSKHDKLAGGDDPAPVYAADQPHPHQKELDELLRWENRTRDHTDFSKVTPGDVALGPNPHAVVGVGDGRFVGALRGAGAVVLLDDRGKELARAAAPASPASIAVEAGGNVLVAGEADNVIYRYTVVIDPPSLAQTGVIPVPDAKTITSVAVHPTGVVYASEEIDGKIYAIAAAGPKPIARCHAPIDMRVAAGYLAVNCLLDHEVRLYPLDDVGAVRGEPITIHHDGPIWGMALASRGRKVYVALAGVEDHTLDRSDGGFGYIDSFAFVYRVTDKAERVAMVDVSDLGVVTPKWVDLHLDDTASLTTAGYGGDKLARLVWDGADPEGEPKAQTWQMVPGTSRAARSGSGYVASNSLLDAWVYVDADGFELQPLSRPERSVESLLGERLFFTKLMAPWNESDGKLSRFTCETCHYEGYVDGRTHYTGREDTHATTKPLVGLFNNRPHFTRALDKSMTKMVNNEFKVANKFSEHDPWFELTAKEFPWLADIGHLPNTLDPVLLRRSLMTFLMEFSHRPNPAVRNRRAFSELEKRGAEVMRDRCTGCHAPRLITDDASTAVPFDDWQRLVLSAQGPIVWASDDYQKTGVEPYVNEEGARTTSLRRLYKKWPYFTNGTAKSVEDVLAAIAIDGDTLFHANAPESASGLPEPDQKALRAFLRLL